MTGISDHLKTSIAALRGARESTLALIQGLVERLRAAHDDEDPEEMDRLIDEIDQEASALAAAVAANPLPLPPEGQPAVVKIPVVQIPDGDASLDAMLDASPVVAPAVEQVHSSD